MRHRWEKMATHNYLCLNCATIKQNIPIGPEATTKDWQQKYHLPNGAVAILPKTPACVAGHLTAERLKVYAELKARQHHG